MKKTVAAWMSLITSVGLFIGGFLVLKAGGILLGFAALFQAPYLIESLSKLSRAKFTKGDLTIELEQAKKEHHEIDSL